MIRIPAHSAWLIAALSCLWAATAASADRRPLRDELIGAWQLVNIEYVGPHGPAIDPYYGPNPVGMLIYEAGGRMSVQITEGARGALRVDDARRGTRLDAAGALARARAFDTYYAYYGHWDYDARRGILTHEVQGSLIPAETGLRYEQRVSLEAGRLVFTNKSTSPQGVTIRRKIWQRLP